MSSGPRVATLTRSSSVVQILNGITLAPFSRESASTVELARFWQREAGRATNEVESGRAAIATARRGGVELAAEARGVQRDANAIKRGVSAARPREEISLVLRATQNSPGVNTTIGNAEQSSGDPRFDAPPPNYGAAEAKTAGPAGGVTTGGREVGRRAGEAQRFEDETRKI